MLNSSSQILNQKLEQAGDAYAAKLPAKVQQIQDLWRNLVHLKWNDQAFKILQRLIHALTVSAAATGDTAVRDAAAQLDRLCAYLMQRGKAPSTSERKQLSNLIRDLRRASAAADAKRSSMHMRRIGPMTETGAAVVYLVEADQDISEYLKSAIGHIGYEVRCFPDLDGLQAALSVSEPFAVVVDVSLAEDEEAGLKRMAQIREQAARPPVLVFVSGRGDIAARLEAVRAGGDAYLTKPIDVGELAMTLDDLVARQQHGAHRVVIVDDDSASAESCASALKEAGMRAMVVGNPMQVMAALAEFEPDLVLLADELKEGNGLELARLIRQHRDLLAKPIVFLSSSKRLETRLEALEAGADDLLTKPVNARRLVATVVNRVRRMRSLRDRLSYLSEKDQTTGLYNRQYFYWELGDAVSASASGLAVSALLYVELDKSRPIIDKVGLPGHDLVIGGIAKLIRDKLATKHVLARLSENTLGVLMHDTDRRHARAFAESIRQAVAENVVEAGERSLAVTCSIGVVMVDGHVTTDDDAIHEASVACEVARGQQGNAVHLFDPVVDEEAGKDVDARCVRLIRRALAQDKFHLLYQPIVNLGGDADEKYEVLVRMEDEDASEVLPGKFLPVAKGGGLDVAIDRWVIRQAVRVVRERQAANSRTTFFIKLSPASLHDDKLLPWLAKALQTCELRGSSLVFEVPETVAAQRLKEAKAFAQGLKELHCGFALEHFGAGLNSSQLLSHLAVDYVKIDSSYVRDLATSQANQRTVRSISDTAHAAGALSIAEFVEDADSLTVLWQCGVNYMQGNFLQAPERDMRYEFGAEGE